MAEIFRDILPSIMQHKKVVVDETNEKEYAPYIINRALSFHYDCILRANQMNILPGIDPLMQYHYYLNSLRGYKRPFQKWQKRALIEDQQVIKEYYNISNEKARDILHILSKDQINEIRKRLDRGGISKVK